MNLIQYVRVTNICKLESTATYHINTVFKFNFKVLDSSIGKHMLHIYNTQYFCQFTWNKNFVI